MPPRSCCPRCRPTWRSRWRTTRSGSGSTGGRSCAGGPRLRGGRAAGGGELALLRGPAADPRAVRVGELELTWYSAPGWQPPKDRPLPLVAFDDPCVLRTRALETLAAYGISSTVSAEAPQLAGVHAAVAAGAGVALMATLGQTPAGLVPRSDLPPGVPLELAVGSRHGVAAPVVQCVADAVRRLITKPPAEQPDAGYRPRTVRAV